eukprot:2748925-Prymnesium_polylepis.1
MRGDGGRGRIWGLSGLTGGQGWSALLACWHLVDVIAPCAGRTRHAASRPPTRSFWSFPLWLDHNTHRVHRSCARKVARRLI